MSDTNTSAAQADTQAEPKTVAEWKQQVESYDLTLAGSLEPEIRTAIEKLRADAVQRKFLAELTTAPTVKVDEPVQQFVVPAVPDTMPVAVAESVKLWDERTAQVEVFLKNNPLPHFIPALKELLVEAREKRAKVIFDFQNPKPLPVPNPPPKIQLPPEVTELVREIIRAETPSIVSSVVQWFKANPEWTQR